MGGRPRAFVVCALLAFLGLSVSRTTVNCRGANGQEPCPLYDVALSQLASAAPEATAKGGPAAASPAAAVAGVPAACGAFEAKRARRLREGLKGEQGGAWGICTHLKLYGLNTAPSFQLFLARQLAPRSVLEFGCGLGTTSDLVERFAPGRPQVVCLEPDPSLRLALPESRMHRLSVDIFAPGAEGCLRGLVDEGFDLVMSFEVAEHVPAQFHDRLVQMLAKATRRWLVFSAARPGQLGTGHLNESMRPRQEWQRMFEEQGLVYMPGLSGVARGAAYHYRDYDLFGNTIVMKHPSNLEPDTQQAAHSLCAMQQELPLRFFDSGGTCKETGTSLEERKNMTGERDRLEAQLWPSLTDLTQSARSGAAPCNGSAQPAA